jgi:DNA-binding response OmpR family regulator
MSELILIIEANDLIRSSIFNFLESQNFDILSASNILQGFQLVKTHNPNLIVCSVDWLELQDFWLFNELCHDLRIAQIPFIFLTSNTKVENYIQLMQLGAKDYLEKPIQFPRLLESIINQIKVTY